MIPPEPLLKIKFCWIALPVPDSTCTPSPVLNAIVLLALKEPSSPIELFDAELLLMITPASLGMFAPLALVPISFPTTRLDVAVAPEIETPRAGRAARGIEPDDVGKIRCRPSGRTGCRPTDRVIPGVGNRHANRVPLFVARIGGISTNGVSSHEVARCRRTRDRHARRRVEADHVREASEVTSADRVARAGDHDAENVSQTGTAGIGSDVVASDQIARQRRASERHARTGVRN